MAARVKRRGVSADVPKSTGPAVLLRLSAQPESSSCWQYFWVGRAVTSAPLRVIYGWDGGTNHAQTGEWISPQLGSTRNCSAAGWDSPPYRGICIIPA